MAKSGSALPSFSFLSFLLVFLFFLLSDFSSSDMLSLLFFFLASFPFCKSQRKTR